MFYHDCFREINLWREMQQYYVSAGGIKLGDYELWPRTVTCLMRIRERVPNGFAEFLKG